MMLFGQVSAGSSVCGKMVYGPPPVSENVIVWPEHSALTLMIAARNEPGVGEMSLPLSAVVLTTLARAPRASVASSSRNPREAHAEKVRAGAAVVATRF